MTSPDPTLAQYERLLAEAQTTARGAWRELHFHADTAVKAAAARRRMQLATIAWEQVAGWVRDLGGNPDRWSLDSFLNRAPTPAEQQQFLAGEHLRQTGTTRIPAVS